MAASMQLAPPRRRDESHARTKTSARLRHHVARASARRFPDCRSWTGSVVPARQQWQRQVRPRKWHSQRPARSAGEYRLRLSEDERFAGTKACAMKICARPETIQVRGRRRAALLLPTGERSLRSHDNRDRTPPYKVVSRCGSLQASACGRSLHGHRQDSP